MLRLTIFWLTITFFALLFTGLVIFSLFSLEFRKSNDGNNLYFYLIFFIPLALLLTMTGTIKKKNSKDKNWGIAGLTIFIAIAVFVIMFSLLLQVSFGGWTNEAILYRNNKNKNISINQQIWDVGALGYDRGSTRIVELRPIFNYFYQVKKVDTTTLDKSEWTFVNEEGDIHYP
jgi:membrane protease YdiL (CAAX protease family)